MSREVLGPPDDGVAPAWGEADVATGAPAVDPAVDARPPGGPVRVTDLDHDLPPVATVTLDAPPARARRRPGTGPGTGTAAPHPAGTAPAGDAPGPLRTDGPTPTTSTVSTPATSPGPRGPTGPSGWPAGAPPWARGPWGLAVAVLAGLLVGALVAGTLAERSRLAAASEQVRVLADLAAPARQDGGAGRVHTGMDVVNAGPGAVTVVGAELAPGGDEVEVVARRRIEPGERAVVPVALTPACRGPVAEGITLEVTTGTGDTTRVEAGSLGGRGLPLRRLRELCRGADEPIDIWRVLARRDGTLTVQLLNTSADDHELGLLLPSGTSATSIPPLPTTVPAGRSAFLQIRLRVDECTNEAQGAQAGSGVRLSLDGGRGPVFEDDATAVAGWFARQVALACGPA